MKCARIKELLSNAIDSELPESERQFVTEHLKVCSECREFYGELKAMDADFNRLEPMAVPENFSRQVILELNKKRSDKIIQGSIFWKLKHAAAYGAVAGVVLLSLFFGNFIGKFLYKEIRSSRLHGNDRNSRMTGIAETRVNVNGISCIDYDRIYQEVHND